MGEEEVVMLSLSEHIIEFIPQPISLLPECCHVLEGKRVEYLLESPEEVIDILEELQFLF